MEALRNAAPASGAVGSGWRTAGWIVTGVGLACWRVRGRREPAVGDGVRHRSDVLGLVVAGPTWPRNGAAADHGRAAGMADGPQHRPNSRRAAATALAHDRPDRRGCGRGDRDLAEGVGLGRRRQGNRSDLILEPAGAGLGSVRPWQPPEDARRRRRRRRAARVRCPGQRPQLPGHGDGHRRTRPGHRPRHRERKSWTRSRPAASWSAPPPPTSSASARATR